MLPPPHACLPAQRVVASPSHEAANVTNTKTNNVTVCHVRTVSPQADDELQQTINDDRTGIVDVFDKIPRVADTGASGDLRFEPLVEKLVTHTRSRIVHVGQSAKALDARCTRSTIWVIQVLADTGREGV